MDKTRTVFVIPYYCYWNYLLCIATDSNLYPEMTLSVMHHVLWYFWYLWYLWYAFYGKTYYCHVANLYRYICADAWMHVLSNIIHSVVTLDLYVVLFSSALGLVAIILVLEVRPRTLRAVFAWVLWSLRRSRAQAWRVRAPLAPLCRVVSITLTTVLTLMASTVLTWSIKYVYNH